ncbi:Cystatin domain containing protein [Trichuris trichiura]|uniref:Cystatin domain containing protein n=1 Tax=Trichuris trichiura TaxID=36087 RepID=A0A077ZLD5_TRITR|nr:Cystatin domain containing protein [Trichuris trichiura]
MLKVTAFLFAFTFAVSSGTLEGGWFPLDVKSEEAKRVAHKSLADRNTKSNSAYHDMLIKIVEASSQVVAGANYKLDVYIGLSNCAKKDVGRKFNRSLCLTLKFMQIDFCSHLQEVC